LLSATLDKDCQICENWGESEAKRLTKKKEHVLRAGDVVRLRSGGPKMTIALVDSADDCHCHWFDGGELKTSVVDINTLEKVEEQEQ